MSPPKSEVKKLAGAITYRTKFSPDLMKEFSFVASIRGDSMGLYYTVCVCVHVCLNVIVCAERILQATVKLNLIEPIQSDICLGL